MYSCPSPTIDRGDDDLEDSVASSPQVWFDTEALEAHENDNLAAIATTAQHSKTVLRSDVQVEPLEEVPGNSESITGVGIQEVARKFAVRNMTELVIDVGWLSSQPFFPFRFFFEFFDFFIFFSFAIFSFFIFSFFLSFYFIFLLPKLSNR